MKISTSNIILPAALMMGCIFFIACENDIHRINSINSKNIGVEEAKDVKLTYTIGGHTKSILTAPAMLNVQAVVPYVEFPQTLHADFYNEQGVIESKLDARYGKYEQNKSVVYLRDSIRVINIEKGDTLYCNELNWDRNRFGREFYTDKPVRIRTKTQWINGKGMESSQDFKNWHIIHSEGFISVPSSKFPG